MVLRNGALLPDGLQGTDLDLSVLPGNTMTEVADLLTRRAKAVGWERALLSIRKHMSALAFVDARASHGHAVHFDVFDGISAYGIRLASPHQLASLSDTRRGVTQLTAQGQVLVTVLHHLAWSGYLAKDRYRSELRQLIRHPGERRWLEEEIADRFGPRLTSRILKDASSDRLGYKALPRRLRVVAALASRAFIRDPVGTAAGILAYLTGQIQSVLRPPGVVGLRGDRIPSVPTQALDLRIACGMSPHAFFAPAARAPAHLCQTVNGPRYERSVRSSWARWLPVRWMAPSLYLWMNAKRGRVVVLDRLPYMLARLRESTVRPGWLALPPAVPDNQT